MPEHHCLTCNKSYTIKKNSVKLSYLCLKDKFVDPVESTTIDLTKEEVNTKVNINTLNIDLALAATLTQVSETHSWTS